MNLNVYRVRESAILPNRAHETDAGMDVFYCPPENKGGELEFFPGDSKVLETGLKIEVPRGYMLQVMNKSGIASKQQLIAGACVVDSGYDGEIFVNLQNIGMSLRYINPGQKIAQLVLIPVEIPTLNEIKEDSIYGGSTSRGDGGFGSTGV